jgi:hypothetical protein
VNYELERRRQALRRAYLVGELSSAVYAWLWRSLSRYGRAWRKN